MTGERSDSGPQGRRVPRRSAWQWAVAGLGGAAVGSVASGSPSASATTSDALVARLLSGRRSRTRRAALRLVDKRLAGALPEVLGQQAASASSPLRRELARVFVPWSPGAGTGVGPGGSVDPRAGAGLLFPSPAVVAWDDFARSDRWLDGDRAPSGHVYRIRGAADAVILRSGRYAPQSAPQRGDVLYVDNDRPLSTAATSFVWVGPAGRQDVVVGACRVGFGNGSIQVAVNVSRPASGADWTLFYVESPNPAPYPSIATGTFRPGFTFAVGTLYRLVLHRTGPTTVVLELPDGQLLTFTHPKVATLWGDTAGFQLRRPVSSDGYAEFTALATASMPAGAGLPSLG